MTSWKENKILAGRVNEPKKRVRKIIKNKTGVAVDQPDSVGAGGTTTTGNTARTFLFEAEKRQILVDCIPEKIRAEGQCDKKVYEEFLTNISVFLRAISSSSVINNEVLETLCKETSIMFVSHWPTFKFTPSVHQVLAHSTALINANGFTGLGSLSEELLEHNNKNLRRYRECLARKTTQYANLSDILSRLWIKSDPIVRSHRNAIKCSACNGHHSIRSCPRRHVSGIGCQTIEEHLISTIINPEVAQITAEKSKKQTKRGEKKEDRQQGVCYYIFAPMCSF